MPDLRHHRALVTGASSGIGREMARQLAAWGCDLTITARRRERLDELAAELTAAHGVEVRATACDLASPDGPRALYDDVMAAGEDVDVLINNAGFGHYQAFEHEPWEQLAATLQLNVTSLVELTHRFLPHLRAGGRRAYVLNVASIAAFQPVPYFACYAAAKSYVRDFSEALAHELAGTGVSVTCLCPGGTYTEFMDHSGQTLGRVAKASMRDAQSVARQALLATLRGRRTVVTGWMNVLSCFLTRFVPRRAAAWSSVAVLGKPAPARPELARAAIDVAASDPGPDGREPGPGSDHAETE
ncbi:SDR family NAD(P)-dependent oxidoreductase [Haliangium sp.]|uniref:SDR family NAD(P)-dependent oxidoreductase n=1 Tax=Haliangium sp. TaxID=2663208 RepID=UPI003D0C3401